MPKPRVIDEGDVIIKITGSTICGSDLHLYHGMYHYLCCVEYSILTNSPLLGVIPQLQKGDVLGHEFCGVVDNVGPGTKKFKTGDRVVASFPIACGDCTNCKKQFTSQCEWTNANTIENALYGKRTSGTS